ncbi:MAG: cyclic nucleotide-binding domain-containing protein [Candidatus Marinimicrobia bacterium]|jgi:CRP/FNR family transcriptional regulator, cyclic AMP receptor protein|nr:cyclic nucleotide-binding domain-containing protein [Candidatus Neomarinimicrobiota bacterium]MBT4360371.1 cyclic nucleotide-binding domain-containing protein [Candidatus Neomarinimicrobiota bacterium]MBT4713561.1 cyclic nucleotide-binding domain-containing protein [Candidatus Neomarinimicrobiota bacterium]MBT4946627.1 cyclic nucleotide-binding domain-containing protein [Candidatus Neomarinimicrobiota bacterium]MBT5268622.1 cyclic nucleotide-binding domain-containing protein [Candidatus Neom
MPHIQHLKNCPLFKGMTEEDIAVYRPATRQVSFKAGEAIMSEGETGDTLVILIKGEVTISKKLTLLGDEDADAKDKTFITLNDEFKPFFGEMAMLMTDAIRTASVIASTDCEIVIMEKNAFQEASVKHPAVGIQVMENIAQKLATNLERESKNVLKLTTAFSLILEE